MPAPSHIVVGFSDVLGFVFPLLGVVLSIGIICAIRAWWNAPIIRAIERMEMTLAPDGSPAVVTCPKCGSRYHVERVDCPKCGWRRGPPAGDPRE